MKRCLKNYVTNKRIPNILGECMVIKELAVKYHCKNCGKTLVVTHFNLEITLDEINKIIHVTNCVNCNKPNTTDIVHIKCILAGYRLTTFKYIVQCNMCKLKWADTFTFNGQKSISEIKTHILQKLVCLDPSCPSPSFNIISCNRVK